MAALDYPSSPTVGQTYSANGKTWAWDGVTWLIVSNTTVPPSFVGCRVYSNATQSVATATATAVLFNVEYYKTVASMHSTSSNTSRLIAPQAGYYEAHCSIQWDPSTVGVRNVWFRVNGVDLNGGYVQQPPVTTGSSHFMITESPAIYLAAGDYVECFVYQSSGTTLNIGVAGSGVGMSVASLTKLDGVVGPAGAAGAAGGTPGGATTQIQYNNAGAFAGSANFTYSALGALTNICTTQSTTAFVQQASHASFDNSLIYGYTTRAAAAAFKLLDLRTNNGATNTFSVDGNGDVYVARRIGIGVAPSYAFHTQGFSFFETPATAQTPPSVQPSLQIGGNASFASASDTSINGTVRFVGAGWGSGDISFYPHKTDAIGWFRFTASASAYADSAVGVQVDGHIKIANSLAVSGIAAPGARIHVQQGSTTAAGSAPIKLTSGTLMTTPEVGAIEFNSDKFYGTSTTGPNRNEFAQWDTGATHSNTFLPYCLNQRLGVSQLAWTQAYGQLSWTGHTGAQPSWQVEFDAATGGNYGVLRNSNAGADSYVGLMFDNSTNLSGSLLILQVTGTGYTASGLITAGCTLFQANANRMLIGTGTAAPVIFYTNGNGLANEAMRLLSGGGVTFGPNATPVASISSTGKISDAIGDVRILPQNSQSADYTAVAADSGKHLLHPSTDANARTFTIPSNASVPYPIGTVLPFVNRTSQVLSVAITTDTMYLAGTTTTGTRSIAQNGIGSALKVEATVWVMSGTGVS
jgi:hypothetical protein